MPRAEGTLLMENAEIRFRNFAGLEGPYNRAGDRNFCLMLDPATAAQMARDGWNIKKLKQREEGDPERPYVQVSVGFKNRPPMIVMITSKGRTTLTEEELALLDWVDIAKVDIIIRPYNWTVGVNSGVKAYLKSLYVTIDEDYLALKYADVPEIGSKDRLELEAAIDDGFVDGEVIDEIIHADTIGEVKAIEGRMR